MGEKGSETTDDDLDDADDFGHGFVRAFYRTLKAGGETGAIGRVFITGGTPILLDDLVSRFHVATNISNREHYNTLAGFTKADVERAIDDLLRDQPELQPIPEVGNREQLSKSNGVGVAMSHFSGFV